MDIARGGEGDLAEGASWVAVPKGASPPRRGAVSQCSNTVSATRDTSSSHLRRGTRDAARPTQTRAPRATWPDVGTPRHERKRSAIRPATSAPIRLYVAPRKRMDTGFPFLGYWISASDNLRWTSADDITRPPRVAHLDSLVWRLRISVGRGELYTAPPLQRLSL